MTDTSPVTTTATDPDDLLEPTIGGADPFADVAPTLSAPAPVDSSSAARPAAEETGEQASTARDEDLLVREGDVAGDYLERLLDIADYDGDIDLDVEGDRAVVAIVGGDLQQLVGPGGSTLEALQELTRLAVQQRTGVRSRLMLDVDGYRSRRRAELTSLARTTIDKVLSSGDPVRLAPMNPFERKVVHDVITQTDGVCSESEGEEPQRRVVVFPNR